MNKNTAQNIKRQQEKAAKIWAFSRHQQLNRTNEQRRKLFARNSNRKKYFKENPQALLSFFDFSHRNDFDICYDYDKPTRKVSPRLRNYIYNNIQPSTGIRGTPSYQSRVNFASQNIQKQKNSLNGEDKLLQTQPIRGTLSSTSYKPWTKLDWWKYHRKKDFRKANEQRKASDRRHEERSQQATVAFQEKMTAKTHLSPEVIEQAKAFQATKKAALQAPIVPPTIAKGNISKFLPTLGFA